MAFKTILSSQSHKDFSITDIQKEFTTFVTFKELGYTNKAFERLKLLKIINNDLGSIDIEDMDKIRQEIEDSLKE